jgi:hypothetical protein
MIGIPPGIGDDALRIDVPPLASKAFRWQVLVVATEQGVYSRQ